MNSKEWLARVVRAHQVCLDRGITQAEVASATGASHTTSLEDPYRQAKAAFAAGVADAAVRALRRRGEDALILVAPARTLEVLRDAIGAAAPVADTLDRDLTKAPDIELERWLAPLERALNPVVPRA